MKHKFYILEFLLLIPVLMGTQELQVHELNIYDLTLHQKPKKDTVGFISLSDNYPVSEHPDSLAVPDVEDLARDESEYI